LLHTTTGHLRDYGCPTGNAEEIALAMSKPGVVFWRPLWADYALANPLGAWREVPR
jgi:hypothetical protein